MHQVDKAEQIERVAHADGRVRDQAAFTPARSPVAIFVAHGMGQQAPFETMDAVATGLIKASGGAAGEVRASTVRIGEHKTQRLEFSVNRDGAPVEVHVYEGYWAPLTEGEVGIRDVMGFLVRAGWNGIRISCTGFIRWMFGKSVNFGPRWWATIELLLALGVVLSLMLMNGLIAAVVAARLLNGGRDEASGEAWPSDALLADLNLVMIAFVVVSVIFGAFLGPLCWVRPRRPRDSGAWKLVNALAQMLFWIWIVVTILAGLGFAAALFLSWFDTRLFADCPWQPQGTGWLWALLFGISLIVRSLLVEFMGDVAAYVSSHTLDRFHKLRKEIKGTVYKAAQAVYEASGPDGGYLYPRVFLLGHSLGSVVMYDTLNALLNDDDLNDGRLAVAERTKLLLTFGSPLDKVAFVFARRNATDHQRALAATVQPLIQDYARFRRLKWINVFARRDIISGALDFFDDPAAEGEARVENVEDPDALIPLVAHTEYWRNELLFARVAELL
jgi:hypothetical protein